MSRKPQGKNWTGSKKEKGKKKYSSKVHNVREKDKLCEASTTSQRP